MKKVLLVILYLLAYTFNLSAQTKQQFAQVIRTDKILATESLSESASQMLLELFPWLGSNQNTLTLINKQKSPFGFHLLFAHSHQGKQVFHSNVKVNIAQNGKVLTVISNLIEVSTLLGKHSAANLLPNAEAVYAKNGDALEALFVQKAKNTKGEFEELLMDAKGNIISRRPLDLFFNRKDTLVQSKVFRPDPLTTAQKAYGDDNGLWVNNGGKDYTELNAQRVPVTLTVAIENDTFFSANKYILIVDAESPAQDPYRSPVNNFDFTRANSAFREMMALYHIETLRNYLKSIGMPMDSMFVVNVDIAAYAGQDQSRFSFQNGAAGLFFGIGGVPDAEDADVIVHEYTHGISYFLAPNTTSGNERLAVDEANSDFMACFHSRAFSTFKWREVFNWDGHNVYWDGRDCNSSKKYPVDLSTDVYQSSLIWSSMLNDLGEDIGRDAITKILLNSIYNYAENVSMQQMADMLVEADSLVYGKMHYGPLKNRFVERGFDFTSGLNEVNKLATNVRILNSAGFAANTGDLIVSTNLKTGVSFEVFDCNGKLMMGQSLPQAAFNLSPTLFKQGVYILKISSDGMSFCEKLIRVE